MTSTTRHCEKSLWDVSKVGAMQQLSEMSRRKIKQKNLAMALLNPNSRFAQDNESIFRQYIGLVDTSTLFICRNGGSVRERKCAVCEKSEMDRLLVYQTIENYRKLTYLKHYGLF